ncbi:hypothetical protein AKJ16_DCAP01214 [Drosera capensis]
MQSYKGRNPNHMVNELGCLPCLKMTLHGLFMIEVERRSWELHGDGVDLRMIDGGNGEDYRRGVGIMALLVPRCLRALQKTLLSLLPVPLLPLPSTVNRRKEKNGGRGNLELHRYPASHHLASSRRLLQVRLPDRVLDLFAPDILRLASWDHIRCLGHHQVEMRIR